MDLVGSTSYKGGDGAVTDDGEVSPRWVIATRNFYREFPALLAEKFARIVAGDKGANGEDYGRPNIWKTVGDEMLFANKIVDLEHLAFSIIAFMQALESYGAQLASNGPMDVKGSAWTASFPAPNVTVDIVSPAERAAKGTLPDEETEAAADAQPSKFDFLGKEMDSGFRVTKHSSSDRLAISASLAYLLSQCMCDGLLPGRFNYHGRDTLKGVIQGRPYPIVTLDMERSTKKKEILAYERALTKTGDIESIHLRNFLREFMFDEKMEFPYIFCKKSSCWSLDGAARRRHTSYDQFVDVWNRSYEELTKREEGEVAAEATTADNGGPLPTELTESLAATLSNLATDSPPSSSDAAQ
ncbi:hypothetical protein Ms3S1_32480 [Methylosinus sp. 3S-1]